MDAMLEDALVEWYETECLARAAGAEAKRGDVVDFETLRPRQNPALARLFGAVEQTIQNMSLLQPAVTTDRRAPTRLVLVSGGPCAHA